MKLVPLVLPIPLFALIITIVAIAIPCHEASANDFFLDPFRDTQEAYGPPLPPSEPGSYEEFFCCSTEPDPSPNWSLDVTSPFPDVYQMTCLNERTGVFFGASITTTAAGEEHSTCAVFGWATGF